MRGSQRALWVCLAMGWSGGAAAWAGGARLHVRAGAPASGADGLSWATAFPDLQQALDVARSDPQSVSEIWVAEGVYLPSVPYTGPGQGNPADPRSRTFLTAGPSVPVYGGLRGDETTLPPIEARRRRPTVLSGDMLGNDNYGALPGTTNFADNVYHVVRVTNGGCWFNGVTIRGGVANSASNSFDRNGGGLRTTNFEMDVVRLEFCRVTYNFAQADGGGLYNNANAYVEGCVFDRNRTNASGGAIRHFGSSLVVVNTVLRQNMASLGGGGAFSTTNATFTNCTVIENSSTSGTGGLQAGSPGTQFIANTLIWSNSGAIGGASVVSNSWVQGATPVDPLLLNTSGPDGVQFTDDDYPFGLIAVNSPLAEQGDDDVDIDRSTPGHDPLPTMDGRGLIRRQHSMNFGNPTVDIGAYEIQAFGEPMYRLAGDGPYGANNLWLGGQALPQEGRGAVYDRVSTVEFFDQSVQNHRVAVYGPLVRFELDPPGSYNAPSQADPERPGFVVDRGGVLQVAAPDDPGSGPFANVGGYAASIGEESGGRVETSGRVVFGTQFLRMYGDAMSEAPATIEVGPGGWLNVNYLLSIGSRPDSWALVRLDDSFGSLALSGGSIRIGDRGAGELQMAHGSQANTNGAADICVGCEAGSAGRILIEDSQFVIGPGSSVVLGLDGEAVVEVADGGDLWIRSSLPVEIGAGRSPYAAVALRTGGRIRADGPIHVGGAGAADRLVTIDVGAGSSLMGSELTLAPGANLVGNGTIIADVYNAGVISPLGEQTPGRLTIQGRFKQSSHPDATSSLSGRLEIEFATGAENEPGVLEALGEAALGGGLHLRAPPYPPPTPGDVFSVVLAESRTGTFDVVTSPIFDGRYFFRVIYRDGGSRGATESIVDVVVDALDVIVEFQSEQTVTLQTADGEPLAGAAADMNGDGFVDLAVVVPSLTPGVPGCVIVLLNRGLDGMGEWLGFEEFASCVSVGVDPRAIVALDVDGDGDLDVAAANFASGSVTVLRNNGLGDLAALPAITLSAPGFPVDIAAADMDLDGFEDLVTACVGVDAVVVHYSDGVGGFLPALSWPIGAPPTAMTVNDLVAGGGPDVAVASRDAGLIVVLSNDGARALTPAAFIAPPDGALPDDIDSSDVDNDKDIDLIAAATQPTPGNPDAGVVIVVIADGAAPQGYRPPATLQVGDRPIAVVASQLNHLGGPDIAVIATVAGESVVQALFNTTLPGGSASFAEATTLESSGTPRFLLTVDVDNDEDLDIVTLNGGAERVRGMDPDVTTLLNDLTPALPGDVNFDGVVNFQDLNIVLGLFNTTGPGSPADLNDDGVVGFADLNIVLSFFNTP